MSENFRAKLKELMLITTGIEVKRLENISIDFYKKKNPLTISIKPPRPDSNKYYTNTPKLNRSVNFNTNINRINTSGNLERSNSNKISKKLEELNKSINSRKSLNYINRPQIVPREEKRIFNLIPINKKNFLIPKKEPTVLSKNLSIGASLIKSKLSIPRSLKPTK